MKALLRRLAWGFLPEGWRRVVLILLPAIGTYYLNQLFPTRVSYPDGLYLKGSLKKVYYRLNYDLGFDDFILAILATILLSLIASWIADGFKKTST